MEFSNNDIYYDYKTLILEEKIKVVGEYGGTHVDFKNCRSYKKEIIQYSIVKKSRQCTLKDMWGQRN